MTLINKKVIINSLTTLIRSIIMSSPVNNSFTPPASPPASPSPKKKEKKSVKYAEGTIETITLSKMGELEASNKKTPSSPTTSRFKKFISEGLASKIGNAIPLSKKEKTKKDEKIIKNPFFEKYHSDNDVIRTTTQIQHKIYSDKTKSDKEILREDSEATANLIAYAQRKCTDWLNDTLLDDNTYAVLDQIIVEYRKTEKTLDEKRKFGKEFFKTVNESFGKNLQSMDSGLKTILTDLNHQTKRKFPDINSEQRTFVIFAFKICLAHYIQDILANFGNVTLENGESNWETKDRISIIRGMFDYIKEEQVLPDDFKLLFPSKSEKKSLKDSDLTESSKLEEKA